MRSGRRLAPPPRHARATARHHTSLRPAGAGRTGQLWHAPGVRIDPTGTRQAHHPLSAPGARPAQAGRIDSRGVGCDGEPMTLSAPCARGLGSCEMLAYDFGHGYPPTTSERLDLYDPVRPGPRTAGPGWNGAAGGALRRTLDELPCGRCTTPPTWPRCTGCSALRHPRPVLSGWAPTDHPGFLHTAMEASATVVQGSVDSASAVWEGRAEHAVNVTGGLHHAMPVVGVGVLRLQRRGGGPSWRCSGGAQRVAYVDIDAHHGDGVQEVFGDDPRVLTVSVHESGQRCSRERATRARWAARGRRARPSTSRCAGTGDAGWLRAIDGGCPRSCGSSRARSS